MKQHGTFSSWIQLGLFTCFLFLLVAIPYTLYIQSTQTRHATILLNPPPTVKTLKPLATITPPPASASATIIPKR